MSTEAPPTRPRERTERGSEIARLTKEVLREGRRDRVAVEEPLEIRCGGHAVAVTMRTPGADEELALGFLYSEGLIAGPRTVGPSAELAANVVCVAGPPLQMPAQRRFFTSSSCGVCGKGALEDVTRRAPPLAPGPRLARSLLAGLPEALAQPGFARTGGLHATALFDARGQLLSLREDVGRHNAMDKVIGLALREGALPLRSRILCVTGRLSYELVQKAAIAGAPILVGIGAPSSLAIELAAEVKMTLAGFARRGRINIYTAPERVDQA
ncbi:MAG TPA: formate dehydrogenase accessory sulfurtransferase FdhD [Solirubrobacteraceae bacterium]|nr:formate dehydrogenase accessory sulfurtransferase FdhD [Solirubrobacteraceae bacterium]